MGKCHSCLSSFRAQFRPNQETSDGRVLTNLNKNTTAVDEVDDGKKDETTTLLTEEERIPLQVQNADLLAEENGILHNTSLFVSLDPRLIIRRGEGFKLKLFLNREHRPEQDVVCLVFTLKGAEYPSYSQGTQISVPVVQSENYDSESWRADTISKDNNSLLLQVICPSTTIVGEWMLEVDTKETGGGKDPHKYVVKEPIYILFNPWCTGDTVYMPDPEGRKEYVMNDNGALWRGSHNRLRPCMWSYGQFEDKVLECCCYLLSKVGKLNVVARADPIRVARHLSAVVNSPDDNGVLVGNWSGSYKGGIPPTHWAGSKSILQQFLKTKKPVKFGQCWVFAAVCTTVARALGIPSRPVTNFSSAHDTHNSLTIDQFYDKEGDPVDRLNVDSVWNFHVWNEVWMERPDLEPGGYGGWQAIDSTPQEESDGLYRCGPASVSSVKRGEVVKPYDTSFLFAEVNADKVNWYYTGPSQPLKLIQRSTQSIGQNISTKAIGSNEREDITVNYKFEEGSREERDIMLRALRQTQNAFSRYYLNEEMEDVVFDFTLLDDIVIGSPFSVRLKAKNKSSSKAYTINVVLRVDTVMYTGKLKNLVKKDKFDVRLEPATEEEMIMTVTYIEYQKALVDQCAFNIAAMSHVNETEFNYFAQDDFRVRMPDIKIETEGDFMEGQEFIVHASLKNPLPKPLKKGMFYLEGPGLGEAIKMKIKSNVAPAAEAKVTCKMTPKTPGEKTIVAKFHSREIDDADGFKTITVKPITEKNINGQ